MLDLRPLTKTIVVTGVALLIGAITVIFLPELPYPPGGPPEELLRLLVRVQLFVTTFNLVLLLALTGAYLSIYRDLPNKYTRSLLVLCVALVLYAITSNPLLPLLFGFTPIPEGPFTFLPDLFVGFAIIMLYYQSQT